MTAKQQGLQGQSPPGGPDEAMINLNAAGHFQQQINKRGQKKQQDALFAERQHLHGHHQQSPADQQKQKTGFPADAVKPAGLENLRHVGGQQPGVSGKPGCPFLKPV
ncbi:hypothetical protein D1872_281210 [compost metagenome]